MLITAPPDKPDAQPLSASRRRVGYEWRSSEENNSTINRTSFHQRISSVILAGCILQIKRGGMKDLY